MHTPITVTAAELQAIAAEETAPTVCYWPDGDKWIVSLDALDSRGRAETTETLDVLDTEEEAAEEAGREAAARGLPCIKND